DTPPVLHAFPTRRSSDLEVMVDGTLNVLEAAADAKVARVVLASSAVVYGEPVRLPIDEDHPLNGTTVYGAAKVANEQMARAFAQDRKSTRLNSSHEWISY